MLQEPAAPFSITARIIIRLAESDALRRRQEYLGTENLLTAIFDEGSSAVTGMLRNRGVTIQSIRDAVNRVVQDGAEYAELPSTLPATPRYTAALRYASRRAHALGSKEVGPQELMLGVLDEESSLGCQLIQDLFRGENLETLKQQIIDSVRILELV